MSPRAWAASLFTGAVLIVVAVRSSHGDGDQTATLTLLGALAVAVLTAWAAEQRLSRQLAAAAERHEREPAHDRDLAALAELRRVLDEAAIGVQRARAASARVSRTHESLDDPPGEAGAQARNDLLEAAAVLETLAVRLELRLGEREPVLSLRQMRRAAGGLRRVAGLVEDPVQDPVKRRDAVALAAAGVLDGADSFRRAAIEVTGDLAAKLGG